MTQCHGTKKEWERWHLERFKKVCPSFPQGRIECAESPDFIVHTAGGPLGIENTEVFHPGPPHGGSAQAQESLMQRIVNRAQDIHAQTGAGPLHVRVLFHPGFEIGKRETDGIAEMLAKLVGRADVDVGDSVELRRTRENLDVFPQQLAIIYISRHTGNTQPDWSCLTADWIPPLTREDIERVIDDKEAKLDDYLAVCPVVWLLIVAAGFKPSATVEVPQSVTKNVYRTRFDRVFLFQSFELTFAELQLARDQAIG